MAIRNRQFTGAIPRLPARLLPENSASVAKNCWLDKGHPRPLPELSSTGIFFPANTRSIYRYDGEGTVTSPDRWFSWSEEVDMVPAPVTRDEVNRVIWTGDDYPRHTSTVIMQGSSFANPPGRPPVSRRLGIPAPTSAPSVSLGDLANPPPQDEDAPEPIKESHSFVYTWLSDLDEEGPPSPPSASVSRIFGTDGAIQPATITTPTGPPADRGINRKRIYRTSGENYRLVGTINLSTAATTESTLTADLGESLVSTFWDPPPAGLKGLRALPNGVLAGFMGKDLYLSEPYQPHAWPSDYIQTMNAEIVGIENSGINLVIGTKGKPYLSSGADPATATPIEQELEQTCVAKRSFARLSRQGVVFASAEGLILFGPSGTTFQSLQHYRRTDWQALSPEDFQAVYHDGYYLAFTKTRALAFNPEHEGVIEIEDAGVKAVWRDAERDRVYVIDSDSELKEFRTDVRESDTARTLRWRSRLHTGPGTTWSACQVIASGYPVELILLAGPEAKTQKARMTVNDDEPFRPPAMSLESNWSYEIQGQHAVEEVRIGHMKDMILG